MKRERDQFIFKRKFFDGRSDFPNPMNINQPLLLFVTFGYDTEKEMNFVHIDGCRNPLPFKEVYGINSAHLISWLKSHKWEVVGHRDATIYG